MHYLELYRFKFGESTDENSINQIHGALMIRNCTFPKFGYLHWISDIKMAIATASRITNYFDIEKVTYDVVNPFCIRQINIESILKDDLLNQFTQGFQMWYYAGVELNDFQFHVMIVLYKVAGVLPK